jgi:transcriptional regulator, propionate catabolism operon regulatory protein
LIVADAHKLPKILVVGYRKFSQLMNTVAPEFRDSADIRILEHLMAADVGMGEIVERMAAEVVISAGANGAYLAATLDVPVLSLTLSDADVVEAIAKARELSRRILLITYGEDFPLLGSLARLADVEIDHRSYQTADEAREQFLLAARAAPEVVVGASLVCELAEREGIPAILLYSRASCRRLLEQALEVAARTAERRLADSWRSALLHDERVPTVLLGTRGELLEFNACAARSFQLDSGGRVALERALEGAGRGPLFLDEQRWQLSRSEARSNGVALGQVLRFLQEGPLAVPARRRHRAERRLVFASREMQRIDELIPGYAAAPGTVLIQGESGTGKELVAHRLYRGSAYSGGELVAINCGAIPEELFESELFGYVDGAFTSSRRGGRRGLFEQANNGVMFLDEIAEMPLGQQAKLLRVLEERRFRALGSNREIALDLKVIAASNCDLRERIREGRFRQDLFYRLNVFSLFLPPLRERLDDIDEIGRYLLGEYAARYGVSLDEAGVHARLRQKFMAYRWPGNVRELENFIERIVVSVARLGDGSALDDALPQLLPELHASGAAALEGSGTLREQEVALIRDAMNRFGNDRTRAAAHLGISQTTLWRRLKDMDGSVA